MWRVVGREVIVVLVEEDVIEENGEDERREATNREAYSEATVVCW